MPRLMAINGRRVAPFLSSKLKTATFYNHPSLGSVRLNTDMIQHRPNTDNGFIQEKLVDLPQDIMVLQTNATSIYTSTPLDPIVDCDKWIGEARKMFGYPTKYCTPSDFNYKYPDNHVPEFAFVGRSNVGKSSLVGALLGDEKLVRTSKMPGCTRNVNYFAFFKGKNSHQTYMVDLPGYGFAKAAKTDKRKWQSYVEGYLRERHQTVLRRVYLLVDSRHGMKYSDCEMMKMLDDCGLPYQIILTKSDASNLKAKAAALDSCFKEVMGRPTSSCMPFVHLVSSHSGDGIDHLKQSMAEIQSIDWRPTDTVLPRF